MTYLASPNVACGLDILLRDVEVSSGAGLQSLLDGVEDARRAGDVALRGSNPVLRGQYLEIGSGDACECGERDDIAISFRDLARFPATPFAEELIASVETSAAEFGLPTRRMISGAGHDAQMMSRLCPTAMVFIPSIGGLSHNPAEFSTDADMVAGANVLLATAWPVRWPKSLSAFTVLINCCDTAHTAFARSTSIAPDLTPCSTSKRWACRVAMLLVLIGSPPGGHVD